MHSRSVISSFVVRCLDSIILLISISELSSLYLATVAVHAGLSLTWSQTPKTGFLVTRLSFIDELILAHSESTAPLEDLLVIVITFSSDLIH